MEEANEAQKGENKMDDKSPERRFRVVENGVPFETEALHLGRERGESCLRSEHGRLNGAGRGREWMSAFTSG